MKKKLVLGLITVAAAALLAACAKEDTTSDSSSKEPLKMWVALNDAPTYRKLAEEFTKETGFEVEVTEVEEADDALLKDAEAAADVILVQSDQLGQLVEAGTVYENEKYADDVKKESIDLAVKASSYDDKLYGYPSSISAMFLYYDNTIYSEEDVKTLDGLISKGKVGLNIAEDGADYRLTPWFISNGAYLYGENGDDVSGSTLNNEEGLNVLKWIASAKKNENIVAVNADEISALTDGKISALFSGTWNANNVKEALGDKMGTAIYPTADFGNGEVNLKAFSGSPIFVVNVATKNPSMAMDLAKYMTSKEAQLEVFKERSWIPVNKEARESSEVTNDQVGKTVIDMTTDEHSVLMPALPEMKNFWPNMNAVLVDSYTGKLPESEMQATLDKLVEDISKSAE